MSTAPHAWNAPDDRADARIDVTDDEGNRLGYLDAATGARTLLAPESRDVFDEVVDFWLTAAGLAPAEPVAEPPAHRGSSKRRDAPTRRTLVIPLLATS